ncbi:sulfotransferase [Acidisphaera sp. S103]|uniref:tetratricopeptide repeat-containing sulfotransferase family protein n=1 Tax=Acidisphaera sp. S103 TaxID=1747223 RepID=UPI00131C13D3|nr:sulfotransferase [Acidisphaera sp. S103]
MAPNSSDILALLGNAMIRLNDTAASVETLTALLALDPGRIDAMINLGTSFASLDRLDQALMWHEKAAVLDPENPDTHTAVAVTARRLRDLDRSTAAARRTLALAPDRTEMWLALGANLTAMGRFAEAEDCCRKALALKPDSAEARRGLTAIGRHDGDAAEISRLHATLDNAAEPLRERISAGMAMGTLLDRSGDYDTAFTAFDAANRLIRTVWNDAGMAFDGPGLRRYVDWAISTFTRQQFTATAGWGDPSELPVFIVGMPRSGTSLVEQIAASHSEVFGTGESKDVSNIVRTLNGGDMHRPPAAWDREAVRGAATAHLDWMREQGGDAVRVIDKMPDNCRILGQIAVLFPRARVIVCRRDPRDVCLSCHFQQFAEGQAWSTDQTELAVRFREIDWLLAHWRAVVPLRILEVRYEDLVANLEAQSRRLIAFLGLDWEPACLAFHETERPVFTASLWQVRQPLYSSSVGRWRNYRKHLGPLLDGLKGLVPDDD